MLSYGESENVVPVGLFKISRIIKKNGSTINEEMLELVRVQPVDKELSSDDRVYMPVSEFIEMYRALIPQDNKESFYNFYGSDASIDLLLALEKVLSNFLSQNKTVNFDAKYRSLDDLNAIYISNGEVRGTNYSIMPYSLGITKKKSLEKRYKDNETLENPKKIYRYVEPFKSPKRRYQDSEPQKILGSKRR